MEEKIINSILGQLYYKHECIQYSTHTSEENNVMFIQVNLYDEVIQLEYNLSEIRELTIDQILWKIKTEVINKFTAQIGL